MAALTFGLDRPCPECHSAGWLTWRADGTYHPATPHAIMRAAKHDPFYLHTRPCGYCKAAGFVRGPEATPSPIDR